MQSIAFFCFYFNLLFNNMPCFVFSVIFLFVRFGFNQPRDTTVSHNVKITNIANCCKERELGILKSIADYRMKVENGNKINDAKSEKTENKWCQERFNGGLKTNGVNVLTIELLF